MNSANRIATSLLTFTLLCSLMNAQQASTPTPVVPRLVNVSGKAVDDHGKSITGIAGATFAIYKDENEGSPLWLETQNVQADAKGNYSIQLGATKPAGLPLDLFTSGEARWLGVRINGGEEQPRVLLLSVPYALKAADAETLGGKPASAFITVANGSSRVAPATEQPNEIVCSSSTACKSGFVPLFSTNGGSSKVTDSIVKQSGSTVTVSGNNTITGNETVGGSISASGLITGGFMGATNGSGAAIVGTSHGTSAGSDGVDGVTTSGTASGVAGINNSNGVGVYGTTQGSGGFGVWGAGGAPAGQYDTGVVGTGVTGVYGQGASGSGSGVSSPTGVWGDTGALDGTAVLGTAADGVGAIFQNNSPSGNYTILLQSFNANGALLAAGNVANGASCIIDNNANLNCTGTITAIARLDNGRRRVALAAIESPVNWFEDAGSSQLRNGAAVVHLDPEFVQTVNTEKDYKVFPVPNGDCKGLFITNKTTTSFEVRELGGGTSNVQFDYRIMALRRNYESVRFAERTNDPDPGKLPANPRKGKIWSSAPATMRPRSVPPIAAIAPTSR